MDGLISVDEARAYAREHWPSPVVRRPLEALLDNCPRMEVEPVHSAEWVLVQSDSNGAGLWRCTRCGFTISASNMGSPGIRYCPNCGAKMDGDEDAAD